MKRLILHNIRSAYNVGSIFRTADAAGVEKIYLSGYTPSPIDRFGRVQKEIEKTSLGAVNAVEWEVIFNIQYVVCQLRKEGFSIVAVEQSKMSIDLGSFKMPKKVVYILGNEVDGIDNETLNIADLIVEIPMQGLKESLNVAVTAGVILFR